MLQDKLHGGVSMGPVVVWAWHHHEAMLAQQDARTNSPPLSRLTHPASMLHHALTPACRLESIVHCVHCLTDCSDRTPAWLLLTGLACAAARPSLSSQITRGALITWGRPSTARHASRTPAPMAARWCVKQP